MAKEIKNYLKSVKEITAPLNWKSAPDSPPTQLAYVTQPEIDMLVKANIHGSMNGKPNKGPKGIISLDGMGAYDSDYVVSKPDQKKYEAAGGASQSSFDKPGAGSMVINNVDYGQAYQDEQNISGGTNNPVTNNQGQTVSFGITPEEAKKIQEEKEKQTLAEKGKDIAQGIMKNLMGGGEDGNLNLTKEEAYANLPAGMHPLRKQYEYLKEKYGLNWANTTQAKVLEGYLSGVPVERGGGLGARDDTYGGGDFTLDPESKEFQEAESYRKQLIDQITSNSIFAKDMMTFDNKDYDNLGIGFLRSDAFDADLARKGLSPEQYFNFRQQLMAADPTAENQGYKDAFPYSSGAGLGALASKFLPGANMISAMFPERDLSGYQGMTDDVSVNFRPLPVPEQSDSNEPVRRPGFMPIIPFPQPEPERPRYPLPGDPKRPPFNRFPFMPDGGNFPLPKGINAFNPMFLGPSFRGSPYTNRGVSPAFYEALSRFA